MNINNKGDTHLYVNFSATTHMTNQEGELLFS